MYLPLPEAYRSLSRPSSPVSTKASTVCPKKLDSMFEISHADLLSEEGGFHALRIFRSTYYRYKYRVFAVKIDVFGNQNIFKDRKNSSQDCSCSRISPLCNFLQSIKSYFSPYGCQRADSLLSCGMNRACAENGVPFVARRAKNGGPDRTRTYDPRLIKAVL